MAKHFFLLEVTFNVIAILHRDILAVLANFNQSTKSLKKVSTEFLKKQKITS